MPQQTERVDHLRGALAYGSAGIPVFPLAPRTKVPLIPASTGGHGLHDATTDLDVIRAWWTRTPNANVGLRTGLVFDVVDLDSEDAVDALEEARGGREPLRGPLVATGKGFHYYVQLAGIGNRAGILPGVDYRGRGGYVVGPPSEHPDGHRYRWVNPLRDELARVPQWLIQLLVPERGPERPRAAPGGSRAYGLGALRRELQRLSQTGEGSRNHQLNVASFNMGRLVAAGDIDETEAASALIEQGQRIGLGATECQRTVASGLGAGCSSPEVLGVLVERMRRRP
jgi:Bifunctional DNA primase/polymerase, N-terminal